MYVVIRCMLIHVMDVCYVAVDVSYVGMDVCYGCMLSKIHISPSLFSPCVSSVQKI